MFEYIYEWLPQKYRIMELDLLFYNQEDGNNFKTLFSKVGDVYPTLIIILTAEKQKFGAFIPCKWEKNDMFGTPYTFLFSPVKYTYVDGAPECFIVSDKDSIKFGYGISSALGIKSDFSGYSYESEVFNNPPLNLDKSENFIITIFEVFTFK